MKTYFATAERAPKTRLQADLRQISGNPVMDTLMKTVGGMIAVLNAHRQILAVNATFLKAMHILDGEEVFGLRPGEVIGCIHSNLTEAGCGTTPFCSTCGAAVAMVTCLTRNEPVEKLCTARVMRPEGETDICLSVRSCPMEIEQDRFILLFLKDVTVEQQRSELERAFFHDISNIATGLEGTSALLALETKGEPVKLAIRMRRLCRRLISEMAVQRTLMGGNRVQYQPYYTQVSVEETLNELSTLFFGHPLAVNRNLHIEIPKQVAFIRTDSTLLFRLLANMITNALEATPAGGTAKVWTDSDSETLTFFVWNAQPIPSEIALRIFQRHFSTKAGAGRGVGTHAMKMFGERVLAGEVNFTTSEKDGTTFRLHLPLR